MEPQSYEEIINRQARQEILKKRGALHRIATVAISCLVLKERIITTKGPVVNPELARHLLKQVRRVVVVAVAVPASLGLVEMSRVVIWRS